MTTPPVLVVGATGQVGSHVLAALRSRGAAVRAVVRDPARAELPPDVEVVRGDLRDPESLRRALDGVRAAFYVSPHEADEVELATSFVRACESAGVRIVFAGVAVAERSRVRAALFGVVVRWLLPSYRGKFLVARNIARSATRPVILVPLNFMQCDEVVLPEIEQGEFVLPFSDAGVNRVDLRDVGEIAARSLVDDDIPPGSYPVAGPASLTGPECAEEWTRTLGRPVRYAGADPGACQAAFERRLSGRKLTDWTSSFGYLRRHAVHASEWERTETRRLLGRPPTTYAAYVARTAHQLRSTP